MNSHKASGHDASQTAHKIHTTIRFKDDKVVEVVESSLCRIDCPDFDERDKSGTGLLRVTGHMRVLPDESGDLR